MGKMESDKSSDKRIRLSLELTPKQSDELKKIESETGESKAEIVRNALRLYAYVARRAFAGDKFQVIDKNKRATDVVFIELT